MIPSSFVEHMRMVFGAFQRSVDTKTIDSYWLALGDLKPDRIAAGVKRAVQECRFFPKASEIRSYAMASQKASSEVAVADEAFRRRYVELYGDPDAPHKLADDNPFERLAREWEVRPPRTRDEQLKAIRLIGNMVGDACRV